jgi:crossover junction endodeoxyribonuclease RusA
MADHLCVGYREVVLPIEFRVAGTPISQQSHNRLLLAAWRETVAAAARAAVPPGASLVVAKVELHVVYYYEDGPTQIPDEDNLVKPVQDALRGIIYRDDDQVMDGTCRKRNIDGSFRVRNWGLVLAEGFVDGREFVHVVVSDAPDPEVLRP